MAKLKHSTPKAARRHTVVCTPGHQVLDAALPQDLGAWMALDTGRLHNARASDLRRVAGVLTAAPEAFANWLRTGAQMAYRITNPLPAPPAPTPEEAGRAALHDLLLDDNGVSLARGLAWALEELLTDRGRGSEAAYAVADKLSDQIGHIERHLDAIEAAARQAGILGPDRLGEEGRV